MATTYSVLYDLFTVRVTDYELDELYQSSVPNWETHLKGFLKTAIPKFNGCAQDLTDRNDSTETFNITLTEAEQSILVGLMVIEWQSKNTLDIRQMNLGLNDSDYKKYAEANNLNAKERALTATKEDVDREMSQYGYNKVDWVAWGTGDFSGSI